MKGNSGCTTHKGLMQLFDLFIEKHKMNVVGNIKNCFIILFGGGKDLLPNF